MKTYLVGGAVRDRLLGLTPKDLDYVVVGSTEKEMLELGFQKTGAHFPVFRHPETMEEYALARTEALAIKGTSTFLVDTHEVTLEEDLKRRDITINSIALSDNGYIDPYGGIKDLENKIIRHTSEAFDEDPLRVLRVARFAARFSDFTIAPETIELMKKIVKTQLFAEISNERIYTEMAKALSYPRPSIFFKVLEEVGGLDYFFPELKKLVGVPQRAEYHPEGCAWTHTMLVLDHASDNSEDLLVRYSALVHDLGKGVTSAEKLPGHPGHEEAGLPLVRELGARLRVPLDWTEAALVVTAQHLKVHRILEMKANSIVRMFYEMDAFRKPHLIEILVRACKADDMGKEREDYEQGEILKSYFAAIKDIGFKDIRPGLKGEAIANEIRAERVRKLSLLVAERSSK